MEERKPYKTVVYPRADPLAKGEIRERDEDLDPQIVWKGATLRLNTEQIEEVTKTGKLEIGESQLTWRGKDTQDWSDLVVRAVPLYTQEKVHPKSIIEDLRRQTKIRGKKSTETANFFNMFDEFNGIASNAEAGFYQHDQNWRNRVILGDSLDVMASLAEREGLRGKVQCIYFDPPYGIKFGSNWQVSTRSRVVKNGKLDQITREPEQVRAFRDTWKDGVHSYLSYLRDRLTCMRDLICDKGSIFVQIGEENVHRVRALMDEVFGERNFVSLISFRVKSPLAVSDLARTNDFIVWFARDKSLMKFRQPRVSKNFDAHPEFSQALLPSGEVVSRKHAFENNYSRARYFTAQNLASSGYTQSCMYDFEVEGREFSYPRGKSWKTNFDGMTRLARASRLQPLKTSLRWRYFFDDASTEVVSNVWTDTFAASNKTYVVQTSEFAIQRCILMVTDPGDIVLDPTCGSGTTATVSEQWGRRWIVIDTSRVSLALTRARLMGAKYPHYLLADSEAGQKKEEEISGRVVPRRCPRNDLRQGFVYERSPRITLRSIANNTEIDKIWCEYENQISKLIAILGDELQKKHYEEWEILDKADDEWPIKAKEVLKEIRELRSERQDKIDRSISRFADVEYRYDRPFVDTSKIRVAGPFFVESLSPFRVIPADNEDPINFDDATNDYRRRSDNSLNDFTAMVLENLKSVGVHQSTKEDRIKFTDIEGWPGEYIAAIGHFQDGDSEKRAAVFIGPEFGTVTGANLTAAACEADDARFDLLIACGFSFDTDSSELSRMGSLQILKAKMNQDLHMSDELKNTGKGNLFTIIGEPDIEWNFESDGNIVVKVRGLDVFDLKTGEIRSGEKDDIAAWFIDTDYDEEVFFVRHAYFLGANDPYQNLKSSLRAEVDPEAWESLYSEVSRPFSKPSSGRIAVKVINHFGDEVMKVISIGQ